MPYTVNSLITRSLTDKDFRFLQSVPNVLFNDTEKVWMAFIKEYVSKYSVLPTIEVFREHNPIFRLDEISEEIPLAYIFDSIAPSLRENFIRESMIEAEAKGQNIFTPEFLEDLSKQTKIAPIDFIDLNNFDRSQYFRDVKRYSYGFKTLDDMTGGLLGGEYVVLYGRAKRGKTLSLMLMLIGFLKQGYNVLVFSNELTTLSVAGRIDSIIGRFNPNVFRSGEVTDSVKQKIKYAEEYTKNAIGKVSIFGQLKSPDQILSIRDNLRHPVDIVMIDALHLTAADAKDTGEKAMALSSVSKNIRSICTTHNLPIIASVQANRQAANKDTPDAEDVAGSDSFLMDVDLLLGVGLVEKDGTQLTKVSAVANRNGYPGSAYYHVN